MKGLRQIMGPIENRVRLMLGRGVVRRIDDARQAQELQLDLLSDESQDAVERLQNYGFTAHPHPGAEALVACVGGLRSHAVAIVVEDRRYRLTGLQQGEVALFDDLGNVVKLGREAIEIVAVSKVTVIAPDGVEITAAVTITGDVTITGTVTVSDDVVAAGISLVDHVHGGVQAGASTTGAPQ